MKRLLVLLTLAAPVFGTERPNPIGIDLYEETEVDKLVQALKDDPYFAGKLGVVEAYGRKVTVDRRGQAPNPDAKAPSNLTDVLAGLGANTKGELNIEVRRDYYDDGTLKHEEWLLKLKASTGVGSQPPSPIEPPKEGKGTGEEK